MAHNRGKFSKLLAPGLALVFFQQLNKMIIKNEWQQWCNRKSSKRAYEEEFKMTGLGQMIQKGEGETYTFDEAIPGNTIRFTHLTYGLAFRVTKEMMEDDLYGVMNKMSSELAKSASYNKDVQAASILNNAFSSSFTGYDGLALCHTAHTNLGDSNTQANRPSSDTDLDLPAVQAALEAFNNWTDDRGFVIEGTPRFLVHATGDIWTAGEILESEFVPNNANNAVNIVRSKFGIKPKHLRFLSDADAWFMIGGKGEHDMRMYIRVDDQFNNDDDPLNGDAIFTGRHRLSTGFGDWRQTYGSQGV